MRGPGAAFSAPFAGDLMTIDPRFLRVAACCSLLSVLTTLLLIFLPEFYAPAPDFAARMGRVHETAYLLRSWVYLLHPFVVFTAALAVGLLVFQRSPVLALAGLLGFLLWACNEAGQQTLTLFAFDRWRLAWDGADEAARATLRINAVMYDGLWDGMYMLLLIGFAIGNACLGVAMLAGEGLARVVGGFLLAACALTVALFLGQIGIPLLPDVVFEWAYPAIQPLGRALIGLWLWREAASRS
jgi:hypothetical protein